MLSLFLVFTGIIQCMYFLNTHFVMDGNHLQNLLGNATLGAVWAARNKEQGSSISVPIPVPIRYLSVLQIQDFTLISLEHAHQNAVLKFSISIQITAVEHRFSYVSTHLFSVPWALDSTRTNFDEHGSQYLGSASNSKYVWHYRALSKFQIFMNQCPTTALGFPCEYQCSIPLS